VIPYGLSCLYGMVEIIAERDTCRRKWDKRFLDIAYSYRSGSRRSLFWLRKTIPCRPPLSQSEQASRIDQILEPRLQGSMCDRDARSLAISARLAPPG
jgi:hypothetical protein